MLLESDLHELTLLSNSLHMYDVTRYNINPVTARFTDTKEVSAKLGLLLILFEGAFKRELDISALQEKRKDVLPRTSMRLVSSLRCIAEV